MGRSKPRRQTKRRNPSKRSTKRRTTRSKRRTKRSKRYGGHSLRQRAIKMRKNASKLGSKAWKNKSNIALGAVGVGGLAYAANRVRKQHLNTKALAEHQKAIIANKEKELAKEKSKNSDVDTARRVLGSLKKLYGGNSLGSKALKNKRKPTLGSKAWNNKRKVAIASIIVGGMAHHKYRSHKNKKRTKKMSQTPRGDYEEPKYNWPEKYK
jgi:hypothetical protein